MVVGDGGTGGEGCGGRGGGGGGLLFTVISYRAQVETLVL